MPYHTVADVQSLMRAGEITIGAGTKPNTTTVETWIEEVEALVNARLSRRYAVPVTGTESVKLLRAICAAITAARVWGVAQSTTVADRTYQDVLVRDAAHTLRNIDLGRVVLTDATPSTGGAASDITAADPPEALFTRDQSF
jgi:hypothetical protein